eukprot:GEMP01105357.1.p1 GENE.GEMP01105357.1~~GEMP01105357.1.p1  ORF type:complete len:155 (+),score=32.71 GEMP01105357.1:210-674(+)
MDRRRDASIWGLNAIRQRDTSIVINMKSKYALLSGTTVDATVQTEHHKAPVMVMATQTPISAPPVPVARPVKSCQTILARRNDVWTQTEQKEKLSRKREIHDLSAPSAMRSSLMGVGRSLRHLLEKDTSNDYKVPDWMREDRDFEMQTLRRVLG